MEEARTMAVECSIAAREQYTNHSNLRGVRDLATVSKGLAEGDKVLLRDDPRIIDISGASKFAPKWVV